MAMNGGAHSGAFGKRRHRRRPVMSEINVTPMVDVMLVLLIIFMVSAPLMLQGVPIELPESQASNLNQDREPLAISINVKGQIFLQSTEIKFDELVPKLKAIAQARGGEDVRIIVRGDKSSRLRHDHARNGTAVGGRLPSRCNDYRVGAGHVRYAVRHHHIGNRTRPPSALGAVIVFGNAISCSSARADTR